MTAPLVRSDEYSLGSDRALVLLYPPGMTAAEAEEAGEWLALVLKKFTREAAAAERLATVAAALTEQKRLNLALADRVHAAQEEQPKVAGGIGTQTTILDEFAEQFGELIEPTPAENLRSSAPHEVLDAPPVADEPERPRAHDRVGPRERQLQIARLLADGPRKAKAVAEAMLLANSTLALCPQSPWFAKLGRGRATVWELTAAGRAALAEAGDVLVPATAEAEPTWAITLEGRAVLAELEAAERDLAERDIEEPPPPEPTPAVVDPSDPQAIARAQCEVIAEAIRDAKEPLSAHEAAHKAGLPLDIVEKRLRKSGPQQSEQRFRYFTRTDAGLWKLTNAGHALADGVTT